jgi:hypothetical protein
MTTYAIFGPGYIVHLEVSERVCDVITITAGGSFFFGASMFLWEQVDEIYRDKQLIYSRFLFHV